MTDLLLQILWRSLPVIVLCSVLVACLPSRRAALRRQLALVGLLTIPALAVMVPLSNSLGLQLTMPWPATAEQQLDPQALANPQAIFRTPPSSLAASGPPSADVSAGGWWSALQAQLPALLIALMLAGALLGLWRWARRLRALNRLARQASYINADSPRLGYHQRLDSPVCFGWRRPTILLPERAREWSAAQRRRALAHEQAHLRHGDWLAQQVVEALVCLCWWHPLYWYLRRSFLRDIEILADAEAVRQTRDRKAYAQDLLALAAGTLPTPSGALPMRPQPPLVQRLQTLINQTEVSPMKPLQIAAIQFATMLLVALLSLAQVQAHDDAPHPPQAPDHAEIEKEIRLELADARAELKSLVESGIIEQELLDELEMLGDIEISINGETKVISGEHIDGDQIRRIVIEAVGEVDKALAEVEKGELRKHRIVTVNHEGHREIRREATQAGIEAQMKALEARERALEREREAIEREREALQRARERVERNG